MVKEKLVLYYYPSSKCTESQCVLLLCLCLSILSVIFKIEGPDPGVLLSGGISPVLWNISTEALSRGPDPTWQKRSTGTHSDRRVEAQGQGLLPA